MLHDEVETDQAARDLDLPGFRLVHQNEVVDIDTPITQGIDHVFAYRDKSSAAIRKKHERPGDWRTSALRKPHCTLR